MWRGQVRRGEKGSGSETAAKAACALQRLRGLLVCFAAAYRSTSAMLTRWSIHLRGTPMLSDMRAWLEGKGEGGREKGNGVSGWQVAGREKGRAAAAAYLGALLRGDGARVVLLGGGWRDRRRVEGREEGGEGWRGWKEGRQKLLH